MSKDNKDNKGNERIPDIVFIALGALLMFIVAGYFSENNLKIAGTIDGEMMLLGLAAFLILFYPIYKNRK